MSGERAGWGEGAAGRDRAAGSPLSAPRLVDAALDVLRTDGLDGLSMRAVADRLDVKAASLYWHVHDRAELVLLVAEALLDEVALSVSAETDDRWRSRALAVCLAVQDLTRRRRDAARLLLQAAGALARGAPHRALAVALATAGLDGSAADEVATLMLSGVLIDALRADAAPSANAVQRSPLTLVLDSGSRGLTLRAGPATMRDPVRGAEGGSGFAPARTRSDRVVVRRLRGGAAEDVSLNPAYAWSFEIKAPTWKSRLELSGLEVRGIHVDSGVMGLECALPPPRGRVPVHISSGVVGMHLRRPAGVAVVAQVSVGSVNLRLDRDVVGATTVDGAWSSRPGAANGDHYALTISSGTVNVTLDEDPSLGSAAPAVSLPASAERSAAGLVSALNVVLDGVAARIGQC